MSHDEGVGFLAARRHADQSSPQSRAELVAVFAFWEAHVGVACPPGPEHFVVDRPCCFVAAPIEGPDVELPKLVELKGDPKTEVSANDLGRLAGAAERRAHKQYRPSRRAGRGGGYPDREPVGGQGPSGPRQRPCATTSGSDWRCSGHDGPSSTSTEITLRRILRAVPCLGNHVQALVRPCPLWSCKASAQ